MRLKHRPADFRVEELLGPLPEGGEHTLYRIRKVGRTSLEVQEELARALGRPPRQVALPGLKDRHAVAVQYASVPGRGPARLRGPGWTAERVGTLGRPLSVHDLAANRFRLVLRDLDPEEAGALRRGMGRVAAGGIPNYFDEQRFGSYVPGEGFPGRRILERDAEGALRLYLAAVSRADPKEVRPFKAAAAVRWGDWAGLLEIAPRPSNYRSLLTYLKDHPTGFRHALNLVPDRILSLWLAAYQSWLWNRILARFLEGVLPGPFRTVTILETPHPLPEGAVPAAIQTLKVPLPHHRVRWPRPELAAAAEAVLAAEGLAQEDLKARILKRAYLWKGRREAWLRPQEVAVGEPGPDEAFPGRWKVEVAFVLPPGSYATLTVRAARALGT